MNKSSVQGALRRTLAQLKLKKRISIHTPCHSYATHLLEAGVNIRRIQQYLERYENRMPKNHIKVLKAIISCRTAACGLVVYDCQCCGQVHVGFRSCGNRHCTICQNHKTRQWLERQLDRQLPGHHFMITFTVPEQLRASFRSNQKKAYSAMFAASSQTLKVFTADDKFIGGDLPGFFGVLHTRGRQHLLTGSAL